tara:strand:+ start:61 stop:996 length:936 start_codon:yes stop_codon:yes gene_type:complete
MTVTIVSLSGGKDSVAVDLHLRELGIERRRVFMDTGWEAREHYEHMEYLQEALGPIDVIRADIDVSGIDAETMRELREIEALIGVEVSPMVRRAVLYAMMPNGRVRWCTRELKLKPFKTYAKSIDDDVINAIGIRHEEGNGRNGRGVALEREDHPTIAHVEVWRPIVRWTKQDVIDIHARHGVRPSPLYLQGAERVGCWPCIYANKSDIRRLGQDLDRMRVMRRVEALITRLQHQKRQETRDVSWFQARIPEKHRQQDGSIALKYPCWPIDRVVQWARTKRGGRQLMLGGGGWGERRACFSWGLCDAGGDK